jgi:hypothetical protein
MLPKVLLIIMARTALPAFPVDYLTLAHTMSGGGSGYNAVHESRQVRFDFRR